MIAATQIQTKTSTNMKIKSSTPTYADALARLSRFAEKYTENTVYEMIEETNRTRSRDQIPSVEEAGKSLSLLNQRIQQNILTLKSILDNK